MDTKKVKVRTKEIDLKIIDPDPPYPPLTVEKTDRELILEILGRLEKIEEKLK